MLRHYRLQAGLTLEELASKLGVKRTTLNAWELGNNQLDRARRSHVEIVERAAQVLGVSEKAIWEPTSDVHLFPHPVSASPGRGAFSAEQSLRLVDSLRPETLEASKSALRSMVRLTWESLHQLHRAAIACEVLEAHIGYKEAMNVYADRLNAIDARLKEIAEAQGYAGRFFDEYDWLMRDREELKAEKLALLQRFTQLAERQAGDPETSKNNSE